MINDFSIELATGFVQSTEQYPVDFDRLWQWAGYKQKGHAKRKLIASLVEKDDYTISRSGESLQGKTSSLDGRIPEEIYLTVDAAKMFAMMALTEKGKEVRRYFLDCEKVVKAIAQSQPQKAPAKTFNPNYLPDRKEAMDKLKEHGATGRVYGAVESYNNALVGIENGKRHEVDELQAYKLGSNYGAVRRELSKRPIGFAKHANHLANTAKQAMRYENYAIAGADSVPEKLKPKKERKQLKAS